MKKVFPAVFLIVGSIIGAGFASGRELSLFFAEFGYNSLYFLPIVFILFYYIFKAFLILGSKEKFDNVLSINRKTQSSVFFDIAIIVIFIIYSSAMFAGSVEVLSNSFIEVPSFLFYIFVFFIAFCVLKFGLKGLVRVNFVLIPAIVLLLVIYAFYSLIYPITNITYIPSSEQAYILPLSIIVYVFGNVLLSYFILSQAGDGLSNKQIQWTSFFASSIICFTLLICILCLIKNGAVVMDASMPFIILTLRLGEPFPLLFTAVLFLGIITSLFSSLFTINTTLIKKFGKYSAIVSCLIVLVTSFIGFENIVNNFYPVIGVFGFFIVSKLIFFEYKNLKKENSLTDFKKTYKK